MRRALAFLALTLSLTLQVCAYTVFNFGDAWQLCMFASSIFLFGYAILFAWDSPDKRKPTFFLPAALFLLLSGIGAATGFSYTVRPGSVVVLTNGPETIQVVDRPGRYYKPIWYEAKSFATRWEWSAGSTQTIETIHFNLMVNIHASVEVIDGELEQAMKLSESENFDQILMNSFEHVLKFMTKDEILELRIREEQALIEQVNQQLKASHIRLARCRVSGSMVERHSFDVDSM